MEEKTSENVKQTWTNLGKNKKIDMFYLHYYFFMCFFCSLLSATGIENHKKKNSENHKTS